MTQPGLRQAALAAIRRMPPAAWPAGAGAGRRRRSAARSGRRSRAVQRTGPAVAETFAFGRELIARLPEGADRQALAAELDALLVRVIRIEAVAAQMKFDISRFTVTAGETVVIELVNKDEMPHNLVVGKEGALETVGLAADGMVALPDAFAKNFVPATPEVLFSIRLLNPGETRAGALHGADAARQLSLHLHVPGPLAHDERHHRSASGAEPGLPTMTRVFSLLIVAVVGATLGAVIDVRAQAPPPAPRQPHVVFVTGDDEYRSEISMPMIAAILEKRHGLRTSVAYAQPIPQTKDHIEGLEALDTADLMVMFTRYRALPDAELNRILAYVKTGKPIVGFRTSTHAFNYPAGSPHTDLNDGFGRRRVRAEVDHAPRPHLDDHGRPAARGRQPSDPARRDAVRGQVVALSRGAAERSGDAAARRHRRQLGAEAEARPVPAAAAGGVDARAQRRPRVLHHARPPGRLRAGVDAPADGQRDPVGARPRRAGRRAPTRRRSRRTSRPSRSTSPPAMPLKRRP